MSNVFPDRHPNAPDGRSRIPARTWLWLVAVVGVTFLFTGVGVLAYVQHLARGSEGRFSLLNAPGETLSTLRAFRDPHSMFPGRNSLIILGLGLDRNWTRDNQMYTKNARTDTLMVARLDLNSRQVSVLSIPRDTWVNLAGSRRHGKINEAHAIGGVADTRATVEELLGISIDYHVVIKQEAIEAAVDGIGGLPVAVEKDMDYDDNWGHLHIHLQEGDQRLSGEQVVGYMRFRHDPEGDFGRIRRQQQVVRAVAGQLRKPGILRHVPRLLNVVNEFVQTDLSPDQRLALASLFNNVELDNVLTATLPCDTGVYNGISYVFPYKEDMEAMTDWLLRGNDSAANRLISVAVKNGCNDRDLTLRVATLLQEHGFDVRLDGAGALDDPQTTVIVDREQLPGAARRVLEALTVQAMVLQQPKRYVAAVQVVVGSNLAQHAWLPLEASFRREPRSRHVLRPARLPAARSAARIDDALDDEDSLIIEMPVDSESGSEADREGDPWVGYETGAPADAKAARPGASSPLPEGNSPAQPPATDRPGSLQ